MSENSVWKQVEDAARMLWGCCEDALMILRTQIETIKIFFILNWYALDLTCIKKFSSIVSHWEKLSNHTFCKLQWHKDITVKFVDKYVVGTYIQHFKYNSFVCFLFYDKWIIAKNNLFLTFPACF